MTVPKDVQLARLEHFTRMKTGIEAAVEKYRDFDRATLTSGQFAAQIMLAILELDPVPETPAPQREETE